MKIFHIHGLQLMYILTSFWVMRTQEQVSTQTQSWSHYTTFGGGGGCQVRGDYHNWSVQAYKWLKWVSKFLLFNFCHSILVAYKNMAKNYQQKL